MHRAEIKTIKTAFNNATYATINAKAEHVSCLKAKIFEAQCMTTHRLSHLPH